MPEVHARLHAGCRSQSTFCLLRPAAIRTRSRGVGSGRHCLTTRSWRSHAVPGGPGWAARPARRSAPAPGGVETGSTRRCRRRCGGPTCRGRRGGRVPAGTRGRTRGPLPRRSPKVTPTTMVRRAVRRHGFRVARRIELLQQVHLAQLVEVRGRFLPDRRRVGGDRVRVGSRRPDLEDVRAGDDLAADRQALRREPLRAASRTWPAPSPRRFGRCGRTSR